ncbi:hypothetical protein V6Z11_A11G244700 [Gossypium hirsutum]
MKTETNPKCKTKKRPKNKILTCEKIRKIEKQLNLSRSVLISLFLAQSEMNDCRLFPSSDISSSRLFHIPKRSVCHQIYGYPASKLPSFTYFLPFSIWFSRPIPIRLLFCQIWNASYKRRQKQPVAGSPNMIRKHLLRYFLPQLLLLIDKFLLYMLHQN